MNIDVILDAFWTEYCNIFPVDIGNHARFFEWFMFKNILRDEARFHFPNDIIEVDFSEVDYGTFDFLMEDYASKAEEYYEICKMSGIKLASPVPALFLESAYCDIARKGNVFKYKILYSGDVPEEDTPPGDTPAPEITTSAPVETTGAITETTTGQNQVGTSAPPLQQPQQPQQQPQQQQPQAALSEQARIEIEKERLNKEYELKNKKLESLSELLRQKIITFDEYLRAVNEL